MPDGRRHNVTRLRRDAISRCNKTVPRNDDFTATLERILREKKGLSQRRFLARSLLLSSLSTMVDGREANENVRRDRIIHCPTKTGGASRLFGKRIHLVRATAILDGDRAKCFSDPGDSIFRFILCSSNTFRKGVIALSRSHAISRCYTILLYYYCCVRKGNLLIFKKYTTNVFCRGIRTK